MKFRIQNVKRKKTISLYYHLPKSTMIWFAFHLSFEYLIFNSKDPQTYNIINFTFRLSEGCHFDCQSGITIFYINNCLAICLKTTESNGRRMELYTILWKNKRERCLRPNLTSIQSRFLLAPCKKMASAFILRSSGYKIWFDFLLSLSMIYLK